MEKQTTKELIKKFIHPIFKDLTEDEINYLLQSAKTSIFEKGEILIQENDIGKDVYLILDGKVDVTKKDVEIGETIELTTLGPGSVLGEISVVTNNPRSATVTAAKKTTALVINIEKIKEDTSAVSIYEKLIQNLAIELSKKLIYFENKIVKYDAEDQEGMGLADDKLVKAPNTILLPFGWKWTDIMHEVPFLAEHGYDSIKLFPPQEFVIRKGNPWWTIYQPVSYKLSSFYGTEEDFIKLIDFCHGYNIKIYIDLILNHMADFSKDETTHVGTNGTEFSKYSYGPLNNDGDHYEFDDFYHFDKDKKANKKICNEDYCTLDGIYHLEHYDLLSLPKLDLTNPHVISILRKYAKYLLSLGVDGFRIDAAKHLKIKAVEKILGGLRTHDGLKPFIYQEYYTSTPMGLDVYSFMEKYFRIGYVTAFQYGSFLADAINNRANDLQKLVGYSFGSSWLHYPENRAVPVIDNHDTERMMPNMLSFKNNENNSYVLGYIFMLAWPFGVPKIMSSFRFNDHNDPIPTTNVWQNGRCTCFDTGSPWVAQHKWKAIANMVLFRSKTKDAPGISHVWANGNQVAFARTYQKPKEYVASTGFVVINATDKPINRKFETGLPDGKYFNLISSKLSSGKMQGPTITVENYGFANIEVAPFDAVAIIVDFME